MRGSTKSGVCFESEFAQNQPGFNWSARLMVSNKYKMQLG